MKFNLARLVPASAQPGPTVGADFIQANLYDPYPHAEVPTTLRGEAALKIIRMQNLNAR
jgi:hypothetical protein